MSENRPRRRGVNVGSASILMIFAVLCLTILSTLSFLSADADRKLAERAADAVTDWYAADGAAAELCNALWALRGDPAALAETAAREEVTLSEENTRVEFTRPAGEGLQLRVQCRLTAAGPVIDGWTVENTGEYAIDDTLDLWPGF